MVKNEIVEVTPKMAVEWLEKNIDNNRTIRQSIVSKYARDMRNGDWKLTHQGIAFNSIGELVDGQHRLWAVVEANVPVKMYVATGLDIGTEKLVDSGLARTMVDQLKFVNDDLVYRTTVVLAMIRNLHIIKLNYPTRYKFSSTEMESFIDNHYNLCNWVYLNTNEARNMRVAGVQVALVSAMANGIDIDDLVKFEQCCSKGTIYDGEYNHTAAIRFRNWLDSEKRKSGIDMTRTIIQKCENAIRCYVENKSIRGNKNISYDVNFTKLANTEDRLAEYYEKKSKEKLTKLEL